LAGERGARHAGQFFFNGKATTETTVQVVQNVFGLSMAFQPNGKAAVAYLGFNGASYTQSGSDGGMYDGTTPAWFQNDAVVSYQQSDGTWQQQTVMQSSAEAPVGNVPGAGGLDDTSGYILGFWPALTFDTTNAILAFRDGHFGNYTCPNPQDWCSGTIRYGEGGPTAWTKSWAVAGDVGATSHEAFGGHNQAVMFNGQPALTFDQMPGGAGEVSSGGNNVLFSMRQSDGVTWTQPVKIFTSGDTQSGPSIAVDSQVGLAVAAVDAYLTSPKLVYLTSTDGVTWSSPDPVVNAGTDGWFPSLAFDTVLHTPHIAYYHCSETAGVNVPGNCPPSQDELRISHLDPSDNWSTETVDTAGGYLPKIGFLSSGKRFVIYRASTADSSIKFALEN